MDRTLKIYKHQENKMRQHDTVLFFTDTHRSEEGTQGKEDESGATRVQQCNVSTFNTTYRELVGN